MTPTDKDCINEIVEYEYTLELQNLSDRTDANDAFNKGIEVGVIAGLQKGRELEAEKAMRFAEFIGINYSYFPWRGWIKNDLSSDVNYKAEALYNSDEFNYYLKQFEK